MGKALEVCCCEGLPDACRGGVVTEQIVRAVAGMSAHCGKVDDQSVVFLADSGGDLVGEVLFRLAAFVTGVDSSVLAFQHTPDSRRFDHFGDLVGLIAG